MSIPPRALARALRFVGRVLLPQDCFLCGGGAGDEPICAECRAELPAAPAAVCPVCALPSPEAARCGACLREPPAFDATRAAFPYVFPIDRMIQALKYRHRLGLAAFFADTLLAEASAAAVDVVLPMPLHPARLKARGFNQAVELARPLARALGLPLELAGVARRLDTPAQAALPRAQRLANLRGAFGCERTFAGRSVLVVDDVMTTGASLGELARALKKEGAVRVENLVVARTPAAS